MSNDSNIKSLATLISDPQFTSHEQIPPNTIDSHNLPTKKTELKHLYHDLCKDQSATWSSHLESLSVQRKLLDLIPLELELHMYGFVSFFHQLPAGQLSFLIHAGFVA